MIPMFSVTRYLRKIILNRLDRPSRNYEQRAYNNLDKLYSAIRPGDVVLVEGRSEMSRLIRLFSGSHWSHAALYVGARLYHEQDLDGVAFAEKFGEEARHLVIEAYSGQGVIAEPLGKYRDYNIRICRPFGIEAADLEQVIENVINRLGMHYDDQNIIAIALLGIQALWRSKNRYALKSCLGNCNDYQVICSGMIAQAFQSVSYPIVPALLPQSKEHVFDGANPYGAGLIMRHYTQITPKDFDLSPNFEIIKYNLDNTVPFAYKSLWADK